MTETDYQIDIPPVMAIPVTAGVTVHPTGLRVERSLSFTEWADVGRRLAILERAAQWAIGDWLNYGEIRYGETYSQAAEDTGYSPGTLMNLKFVSSRIESSRRRENLSFSHHAEVAGISPREQDYWLDAATAEGWSAKRLRSEVHPDDLESIFNTLQCPECGYEWESK